MTPTLIMELQMLRSIFFCAQNNCQQIIYQNFIIYFSHASIFGYGEC